MVPAVPRTGRRSVSGLRVLGRREKTGSTGRDHKSGHVDYGPNESMLFFDNLFPLRLGSLLWRPWPWPWPWPWQSDGDLTELLRRFEKSSLGVMDPIKTVKRAIPDSVPIKVTEIMPRLREGGAFVKFRHDVHTSPRDIEARLAEALRTRPVKPWFNPFGRVRARLVEGVPWLEDLYRLPRTRLRVDLAGPDGPDVAEETLFGLFRPYGRIADMTPQPPDSKVLPRFAHVDFVRIRDAIMARNCLHGYHVAAADGVAPATLRLSYEPRVKPRHVWHWLTTHPRIVIPLVAALVAALTVAIFDPIRAFFIKAHVQQSFRFSSSRLYTWFRRRTHDMLAFHRPKGEQASLNALFSHHHKDLIDSIRSWLRETADSFIVVHGPRGAGKRELVLDQALAGRANVLVLDCKPVVEARGDAAAIARLAAALGYRPVFAWAHSLSRMVDLAVQSTTGVQAGFSETLEAQVAKILQATAAALKDVALAGRRQQQQQQQQQQQDQDARLSDDGYLEAHPERRPVVVIDNFWHRNEEAPMHDKIAEWAAALVQANIAHVIVLTTDMAYANKSLSKTLPDRVFHQVALGDLSPDMARSFVLSHQTPDHEQQQKRPRWDRAELDECIDVLGGRLTDLQQLARRLKTGQTPEEAVTDMIDQSAAEILRRFLLPLPPSTPTPDQQRWSPEQAWHLIQALAQQPTLRYNEVLLSGAFAPASAAAAAALEALAAAELVTVRAVRGRPQTLGPGRPVYRAAFARLAGDGPLRARLDLAALDARARAEARAVAACEAELAVLRGALPAAVPAQAAGRVGYLLDRLQACQGRIEAYEREMEGLRGEMRSEA
ncbi:hypothetical protein P8C59_006025 [Phyllachora maydis]|uniref:Mitochondrial escape protein 2 n=1 Tax=Phyllachora maydis TaxID=1825666 RepID=A0AAD9I7A2_9PEZI|nr:hypothetical protein P8C59_006025 [Phyllachora maydis]